MIIERFRANGAREAVVTLKRVASEHGLDIFRGQLDARWPVTPSAMRAEEEVYKANAKRMALFAGFCRNILSTLGIQYGWDDIFAIAQHYGIPTNFLDFSTSPEVAAYFATDSGDGQDASVLPRAGALYGASRASLNRLSESLGPELLRLVDVSTENLWRLEAQQGLFVELRAFESDCLPLIAVEFDHAWRSGRYLPREEIYPSAKSALEIDLSGFFDYERRLQFRESMTGLLREIEIDSEPKMVEPNTTPRVSDHNIQLTYQEMEAERNLHKQLRSLDSFPPEQPIRLLPETNFSSQVHLKNGLLPPHQSWFLADDWRGRKVESYNTAGAGRAEIEIGDVKIVNDFTGMQKEYEACLSQTDLESFRAESVRFGIQDGLFRQPLQSRVQMNLELMWDGLRSLPMGAEVLIGALARYCAWESLANVLGTSVLEAYEDTYGDEDVGYLRAECAQIGSPTHQYYFESSVTQYMLRDDLDEHLTFVTPFERWAFPAWLLTQIIYPQYLFDFERFAEIYVSKALPDTMAIYRNMSPCFNPLQTKVFGRR